jgi:hypothetical protein
MERFLQVWCVVTVVLNFAVVSAVAQKASVKPGSDRGVYATIKTDLDDYAPLTAVKMSGSGWLPGETVTLILHEEPNPRGYTDSIRTAVADKTGNIYNDSFSPEMRHIGVRFFLTAIGRTSARIAKTTFTDALAARSVVTRDTVTAGASTKFSRFHTELQSRRVQANTGQLRTRARR